jgi:hypothetical protein
VSLRLKWSMHAPCTQRPAAAHFVGILQRSSVLKIHVHIELHQVLDKELSCKMSICTMMQLPYIFDPVTPPFSLVQLIKQQVLSLCRNHHKSYVLLHIGIEQCCSQKNADKWLDISRECHGLMKVHHLQCSPPAAKSGTLHNVERVSECFSKIHVA